MRNVVTLSIVLKNKQEILWRLRAIRNEIGENRSIFIQNRILNRFLKVRIVFAVHWTEPQSSGSISNLFQLTLNTVFNRLEPFKTDLV